MARITVESIKQELGLINWDLISAKYQNLQTEMTFKCNEGHEFQSTWGTLRGNPICPICKANPLNLVVNEAKVEKKKKGEIRILGLDQATHVSGYAIVNNDKILKYGTFTATGNDEAERFIQVRNWMLSLIQMWEPDHIWIEGVQLQDQTSDGKQMGATVYSMLSRLQGVLMVAARERGIPLEIVSTNTWRAANKVKGRTRQDKKNSMKLIVKELYDVSVTDDCADAIGIALYGQKNYKPIYDDEIEDWT